MTVLEIFEMTTRGGATDFSEVIQLCRSLGPYCLIDGLAVNCYVEPVYTMEADLVLVQEALDELPGRLSEAGFVVETFPHSIPAQRAASQLRIQFTTDARYRDFPSRAREVEVLGEQVAVAALEDIFQGKLWAWSDSTRRVTKRKKDELDLLRLAEAHPAVREKLPDSLRSLLP